VEEEHFQTRGTSGQSYLNAKHIIEVDFKNYQIRLIQPLIQKIWLNKVGIEKLRETHTANNSKSVIVQCRAGAALKKNKHRVAEKNHIVI
jgi:hypothetical protein